MFPVGPEKHSLIKPFFKCIQGFEDEWFIGTEIYFGIITHTFKQAYFTEFYKPAPFAIFHKYLVMFC